MDAFWLVVILYIVIGIFFVGILNGFTYTDFDIIGVFFMIFYPIAVAILLVMGIVGLLYNIGKKLGKKAEEFTNNIDWWVE